MDIEGAEYDLMIDFINKGVLKLIDYIAIEYHPKIAPFKKPQEVFNKIITTNGIKFAEWG